jgi:hypothetical protein
VKLKVVVGTVAFSTFVTVVAGLLAVIGVDAAGRRPRMQLRRRAGLLVALCLLASAATADAEGVVGAPARPCPDAD